MSKTEPEKSDWESLQYLLEQLTSSLQHARNILKAHDEMIKLQIEINKEQTVKTQEMADRIETLESQMVSMIRKN